MHHIRIVRRLNSFDKGTNEAALGSRPAQLDYGALICTKVLTDLV